MAVVQQRGNKWQCRIRRKGFPDVTKSFLTKEDAQKWARGIERQMTDEQVQELRKRVAAGEKKAVIARDFEISRETLYQYLKEAA